MCDNSLTLTFAWQFDQHEHHEPHELEEECDLELKSMIACE